MNETSGVEGIVVAETVASEPVVETVVQTVEAAPEVQTVEEGKEVKAETPKKKVKKSKKAAKKKAKAKAKAPKAEVEGEEKRGRGRPPVYTDAQRAHMAALMKEIGASNTMKLLHLSGGPRAAKAKKLGVTVDNELMRNCGKISMPGGNGKVGIAQEYGVVLKRGRPKTKAPKAPKTKAAA